MEITELAVWSAMLGGLLTLAAITVTDTLFNRNIHGVRNLLFVFITGTSCVALSGLPVVLFPDLGDRTLMLLQAGMGPLGAAFGLNYLGLWLGGAREDPVVHRITAWGSRALFLCAITLVVLAAQASSQDYHSLLLAAAAANMTAAVLGVVVSVRAAVRGDTLARWMVLACVFLAAMTTGLYLRALHAEGLRLGTWLVTAAITVTYFLIVSVLVITRLRQSRRLARLARLKVGVDPATGLPTGSVLLSKVEHAFWRTARIHGECTVVCLHMHNLYRLGESMGQGVEQQILMAMAARIRRAAGFRCVVGLYHPRCFVVVLSTDKRVQTSTTVLRLRHLMTDPVSVAGRDGTRHEFLPLVGMGAITLNPAGADPLATINETEQLALDKDEQRESASNSGAATNPGDLVAA